MKKLLALLLCVLMLSAVLCACEETVEGPIGTRPTEALAEVYFPEATFLLQPTSVLRDVVGSGFDKSAADGEFVEVQYYFTVTGDVNADIKTYADRLQADGLQVNEVSQGQYTIYREGDLVAELMAENDRIYVVIILPAQ